MNFVKIPGLKKLSLYLIALSVSILFPPALPAQSSGLLLRFGFYTKDLGRNELAEMDESLKQWVEAIKNNTNIKPLANSVMRNTFYESKFKLVDDIKNNKLDFMNLSTYDFFDLKLQDNIIPLLATSKEADSKFERYFLVANKNSEINNLSQLSNAQIVIPNSFSSSLAKIWLQVELKEKLSRNDFKNIKLIESPKKENETLFSIFFNKLALAVIKEDSYLTASEINPQIRKNTIVIAASKRFINNFFARSKEVDPTIYKEIINIGLGLDKTVEGKQILNLMQMTNMHEISLGDLEETSQLIKSYKELFPSNVKQD